MQALKKKCLLNEWSLLRGKEQDQKWEFIVGSRSVHHINDDDLRLNFWGSTFIEGQEGEEIAKARPEIQRITVPGTLKKKQSFKKEGQVHWVIFC